MKVALVYDRLNKWGGAERVLLAIHELFPEAPIYTSVFDRENAKWAQVFEVRASSIDKIKILRSHNDKIPFLMPIAFESFNFDEFDLVISISSEAAKGIITKPKTRHINYCLTPTRYLWSSYDEYFKNNALRFISSPIVRYLRTWDKVAATRPDEFASISSEVSGRIEKYYKRESKVIYPPVMLQSPKITKESREKYFLLVSRFSRRSNYKKVDLAIDAFNKIGWPLRIVGEGPLASLLKLHAKNNIEFVGKVTDETLSKYYTHTRALIFPGLEDFGLVMAEAQSFGAPVIAYKGGGATEIIREGETGEFFERQTAESLIDALKRFDTKSYNKTDIVRNSERFSFENFKTNFTEFINNSI